MKKLFFLITFLLIFAQASQAALPVKIAPDQIISTVHGEIKIGDSVRFVALNDVRGSSKTYIKAGAPIIGIVDMVEGNGWVYDNAQIIFKTFKVRDTSGQILTISSPLTINGFEMLKYKSNRFAQFFNYCGIILRGKEIEILPQDDVAFTIWLDKN